MATPKKGRNFYLPPELSEFLDELAKPLGDKRKWLAISAAILMFAERSEVERDLYIQEVYSADFRGELKHLIEDAEKGKLAEDTRARLKLKGAVKKRTEAGTLH